MRDFNVLQKRITFSKIVRNRHVGMETAKI